MVVAVFGAPDFGEVPDHGTHLGLNAVFGVIVAQETDQLPVFLGQLQPLVLALGPHEVLGPVAEVFR